MDKNDYDKNDLDKEIRLQELEMEKSKLELRNTLVKIWVFCIVALAIVAIKILLRDNDNPNSFGYLLLLVDFNLAMWPPLIMKGIERRDASGDKSRKNGK